MLLQAYKDMTFVIVIDSEAWWEEGVDGTIPLHFESICKSLDPSSL